MLNALSSGSIIADASVKITKFPFLPLKLWSKFLIPTLCLNAYEYRYLILLPLSAAIKLHNFFACLLHFYFGVDSPSLADKPHP